MSDAPTRLRRAPAATPPTGDNVPEFGVAELGGAIRRTLEGAFDRVRVRGEITECKRWSNGHIYLSLKEETAKLEAVIWKMTVPRLTLRPEDGIEVIATGRITTYADRSKYQLVIDQLDWAGEGALLARIEALRGRLLAEGLFDPARKRALPLLPARVGVITSEAGAVLHDIRTTIARRCPRPILLWPVPVQGPDAAARIAHAIAGMARLPPALRPAVVIVARGGGALEDLMAFNDEAVVRAAAASALPLISAVGHETDTTLIDFAADRRAPTPTAAAELAVPSRAELLADLEQRGARLRHCAGAAIDRARRGLVQAERRLPDLPNVLAALRQRVEDRGYRLALALPALLGRRREALARLAPRLRHPRERVAAERAALAALSARADAAWARGLARRAAAAPLARLSAAPVAALLRERRARLEGFSARLEAVSHTAVLARGFALVTRADGTPVTSAALPAATRLSLRFADGTVGAVTEGTARRERGAAAAGQGALL